MILLNLFSQYKNKWWASREESLKREFAQKEIDLLKELHDKEREVAETIEQRKAHLKDERDSVEKIAKENELYEALVHDRRIELEKANTELKQQIRLIEAKASPDSVWTEAFSLGFSKAWDMMLPLMRDGFDKLKDKIRTDAIEDSIKNFNDNVNASVAKKIESMQLDHLKSSNEIRIKMKDLEDRIHLTSDKNEITQLKNYINALKWILNDDTKN
jgi:hypothetical protein